MSITKAINVVSDFLFEEPIRDYGYALNVGEGIGSLAMMGVRVARARVVNALSNDDVLAKVVGVVSGVAIGLLTAPATFIGALIRGISAILPHSFHHIDDTVLPVTSPHVIDQVYALIEQLDRIATKHGLSYWATGGTLLGAMRSKGMIRWDDDGDFAMRASDLPKLVGMKDDLAAAGIVLYQGPLGLWKLQFTPEKRQELFKTDKKADLDMVLVAQNKRDLWVTVNSGYRDLFPKEVFFDDEIATLECVPFGPKGLTVPVPKNAGRFLKDVYGKDCMQYGVRTHTHDGFFGLKIGNYEFNPVLMRQKVRIVSGYAQGNVWKD